MSILFASAVTAQQVSSENDLKKQADHNFSNKNYEQATSMYSQLLSIYPQNSEYNLRYGVCVLYSGKDKTVAINFLENALRDEKRMDEVHQYLGRAYMYGERYDEAIAEFQQCKKVLGGSKAAKLNIDMLIANCESAKVLNNHRRNFVITAKKDANVEDFFATFDYSNSSGRVIFTNDKFVSNIDKSKKFPSHTFISKDRKTIFFSSYGTSEKTGKDIYKAVMLPDGKWSTPVNIGTSVNTDLDEDFPFLAADGKTLYFCSKGHNSVGGYDIFKSTYDFSTGLWSAAENVGVPINTAGDELLYVPDLLGVNATYATNVLSEQSRVQVRNIKIEDPVDMVAIKGQYISKDQAMRHDARITVVRQSDLSVVTSVQTDAGTGEYDLVIPPGQDYMLVVEGGGYVTRSEHFSLPQSIASSTVSQKIEMDREGQKEEMVLNNYFAAGEVNKIEYVSQAQDSQVDVRNKQMMKQVMVNGKMVSIPEPVNASTNIASDNKTAQTSNDKAAGETNSSTQSASNKNILEATTETKSTTGKTIPDEDVSTNGSANNTNNKPENTVSGNVAMGVVPNDNHTDKEIQENGETGRDNLNGSITLKEDKTESVDNTLQATSEGITESKQTVPPMSGASNQKIETATSSSVETVAIAKRVEEKKTEAHVYDVKSKDKIAEAQKYLLTDPEKAKELFAESKDFADSSESSMQQATMLENSPVGNKFSNKVSTTRASSEAFASADINNTTTSNPSTPEQNFSTTSASNTQESNAIPETVAPKAVPYVRSYQEKMTQAAMAEEKHKDLQSQILSMPEGVEKQKLVQKANDAMRESIIDWQIAQRELASARAADPAVDEKMNITPLTTGKRGGEELVAQNQNTSNSTTRSGLDNNSTNNEKTSDLNTQSSQPNDVTVAYIPSATEITTKNHSDPTQVSITATNSEKTSDVNTQSTQPIDITVPDASTTSKQITTENYSGRNEVNTSTANGEKTTGPNIQSAQSGDNAKDASASKQVVSENQSGITNKTHYVVGNDLTTNNNDNTIARDQVPGNNSNTASNQQFNEAAVKSQNVPTDLTLVKTEPVSTSAVEPSAIAYNVSPKSVSQGTTHAIISNYLPTDESTFSMSFTPAKRNVHVNSNEVQTSTSSIAINPDLPEGLVFKVQIGAFRKPMSEDVFKGLKPLSGETSRPGWIRYCLGMFRTYEPARLVKDQVRTQGYKDAFVVAYLNGKRISLTDAYAMLASNERDQQMRYEENRRIEFAHLAKFNIVSNNPKFYIAPADAHSVLMRTVSETTVQYAVQVGAYKTNKVPSRLKALMPLNTELVKTGLYRFITPKTLSLNEANDLKSKAVANGVKDAFIVVYKGGRKVGSLSQYMAGNH